MILVPCLSLLWEFAFGRNDKPLETSAIYIFLFSKSLVLDTPNLMAILCQWCLPSPAYSKTLFWVEPACIFERCCNWKVAQSSQEVCFREQAGCMIVLCSLARHNPHYALFTQEPKWLLVNCKQNLTKCWSEWGGVTCNGPASHTGGMETLLVASCYRNQNKLFLDRPLGQCTNFLFF